MSSVQVFLTRPAERIGSVPDRLRAAGICSFSLPALEVRPRPVGKIPDPAAYDLVLFVSRYAAQRYLQLLEDATGEHCSWPKLTLAATVGASSAVVLKQAGLPPECIIHPPADEQAQDSEALLSILDSRGVQLARVLVVRGTQGREWLADTLRARGVLVEFLPVYERVPAAWSADMTEHLRQTLKDPSAKAVFLLTSSEGVMAIAKQLAQMGLLEEWAKSSFLVIHERIAATLQSVLASQRVSEARRVAVCTPDDEAIVAAIQAVAGPTAEP